MKNIVMTKIGCFSLLAAGLLGGVGEVKGVELKMNSPLLVGPGSPFVGSGKLASSFFDVFVDLDVVSPPASFFDVFVHLEVIPGPPLPPGPEIPIEILALNLVSVNPIVVTFPGDSTLWNVVGIHAPQQPSASLLGVDQGGGLYQVDSFFDIFVELDLQPIGPDGQPSGPLVQNKRNAQIPSITTVPDAGSTLAMLLLPAGFLGVLRRGRSR